MKDTAVELSAAIITWLPCKTEPQWGRVKPYHLEFQSVDVELAVSMGPGTWSFLETENLNNANEDYENQEGIN